MIARSQGEKVAVPILGNPKSTFEIRKQMIFAIFRLLQLVCGIFRSFVFQMHCFTQNLLPVHAVFKNTQLISLWDYSHRFF